MKTIRRLYFYAVAFISLEVVLWGLIGLLRSMLSNIIIDSAQALARALSLILVGVPIFLVLSGSVLLILSLIFPERIRRIAV